MAQPASGRGAIRAASVRRPTGAGDEASEHLGLFGHLAGHERVE
jgi:hypothetical protein